MCRSTETTNGSKLNVEKKTGKNKASVVLSSSLLAKQRSRTVGLNDLVGAAKWSKGVCI